MRFIIGVKASKDSDAGKLPRQELLAAMATYNENFGAEFTPEPHAHRGAKRKEN